MTVSSVKTGEVGLSFALNNNFMEPIATTLVGSGGTNNITFNDIPQTYKHLQVRATMFVGAFCKLQANSNVSTSTYDWYHVLAGNGTTMTGSSGSGYNGVLIAPGYGSDANYPGVAIIDILDYTSTNKNKTVRIFFGNDRNGSGNIELDSGLIKLTDALNSITLIPNSGSFSQHSRFSLYGIKG